MRGDIWSQAHLKQPVTLLIHVDGIRHPGNAQLGLPVRYCDVGVSLGRTHLTRPFVLVVIAPVLVSLAGTTPGLAGSPVVPGSPVSSPGCAAPAAGTSANSHPS